MTSYISKIMGAGALGLMLAVGTSSCQQNDYLVFDQDYSGIYFTEDSLHYSFSTLPIETRTYTQEIPVQIMGKPYDYDRTFSVEVQPSIYNETPQAGKQYLLDPTTIIIPKNEIEGYIPLVLLRDGLAGDEESGYTRYEIRLRLIPDNNFTPTLSEIEQNVVVTFDNSIEKPKWYNEGVWIQNCGEWAPIKLIKVMEHFHTTLKENAPSTYSKMVDDIGENWENVTYGWPNDYKYTVKKYILIPCYEYFQQHPEHGITDFPNPV
ncbi:MAG: DUF4843 domain-containing protein [Muribaculaceae bacterium]|nr:DUF4843 domain-containing protein [Muribaculaceae bacterium]